MVAVFCISHAYFLISEGELCYETNIFGGAHVMYILNFLHFRFGTGHTGNYVPNGRFTYESGSAGAS